MSTPDFQLVHKRPDRAIRDAETDRSGLSASEVKARLHVLRSLDQRRRPTLRDNDDRARCVLYAMLADRAEHDAGECAVSAAADHE